MFDTLLQILCAFGSALPRFCQKEEEKEDVIGQLPAEVTATIFRYLDAKSLVSAAGVNRRWKSICSGDVVLRRRIRRQLRAERKARIQNYFNPSRGMQIIRTDLLPADGIAGPFSKRNGKTVKRIAVEYEVPIRKPKSRTSKISTANGMVMKKQNIENHFLLPRKNLRL